MALLVPGVNLEMKLSSCINVSMYLEMASVPSEASCESMATRKSGRQKINNPVANGERNK